MPANEGMKGQRGARREVPRVTEGGTWSRKENKLSKSQPAFSRRGPDMCLVMQQPPHQPKLGLTEVIKGGSKRRGENEVKSQPLLLDRECKRCYKEEKGQQSMAGDRHEIPETLRLTIHEREAKELNRSMAPRYSHMGRGHRVHRGLSGAPHLLQSPRPTPAAPTRWGSRSSVTELRARQPGMARKLIPALLP
ncbi:hypothetical protein NQZ68_023889 [Dissostichus eleginoides]|nr:hypothetical protein NQZ68_023889 [Dissostichus eleginoides]